MTYQPDDLEARPSAKVEDVEVDWAELPGDAPGQQEDLTLGFDEDFGTEKTEPTDVEDESTDVNEYSNG